jgi:hypothetical protein
VLVVHRDVAIPHVLGLEQHLSIEVEDLDGHAGRREGVQVREPDEDVDAGLAGLAAQVDGAAQFAALGAQVLVDLAGEVTRQ